jgi:type 1 fimbriae regulatory protein FimB/type 1 fimbriae regulatory protein FimE
MIEVGKATSSGAHQINTLEAATQVKPNTKNGKVVQSPPRRQPNRATRTREHLTPGEVERLISAAGKVGRYGHRDATLLLLAYRHGLRVSELVELLWSQIELKAGLLHVTRRKNGLPSTHPLRGRELRALKRLRTADPQAAYVFLTERGGPLTTSNVRKLTARAGRLAQLPFPVHPHMLRHATGFYLANAGHDTRAVQQYLGHRNIQHTVRYTELAPNRFKDFWSD